MCRLARLRALPATPPHLGANFREGSQFSRFTSTKVLILTQILEKAFAKLCGSYQSIEYGSEDEGLVYLTGTKLLAALALLACLLTGTNVLALLALLACLPYWYKSTCFTA